MICLICKDGTPKLKKCNENFFNKIKYAVLVRKTLKLFYGSIELPPEFHSDLYYHSQCYKNLSAIGKKYFEEYEKQSNTSTCSDQNNANSNYFDDNDVYNSMVDNNSVDNSAVVNSDFDNVIFENNDIENSVYNNDHNYVMEISDVNVSVNRLSETVSDHRTVNSLVQSDATFDIDDDAQLSADSADVVTDEQQEIDSSESHVVDFQSERY